TGPRLDQNWTKT
ncbi:hypothetical protein BIW11_04880, partial [Tropilaelaps mercedesae]